MNTSEFAQRLKEDTLKSLKLFSSLQPNHPFAIANKNITESQQTWPITGGTLSFSGALWWALTLRADFAPPNFVIFSASGGPDFDLGIGECNVEGDFYVDPQSLNNKQGNFRLGLATMYGGIVFLKIYDTSWNKMYASVSGPGLGFSFATLSGQGTFGYNHKANN